MVRISLDEAGDSRQLLFSRIPFALFQEWDDKTHLQTAMLADNIQAINISYYGKLPDNNKNDWQDNWTERKVLPLLVKINIVRNDGITWPELTVRLQHTI
jgi:general secretion pathway protein J